jgi:hypothetical protein
MKRSTFNIHSKGTKPASRKGLPYLYIGILILLAVALFSGCSLTQKTSNEILTPEPPEFTYSVSVSAAPIQISSGNLHWHRELPSDSYTLEDTALEIYNLGDFDIAVAQLEITVDEDARLFDINLVIVGGARESISLQPMMEGYNGGVHRVYMSLLDDNGGVLYRNQGEDIGPLEPEPGTGSWHSMPN